MRKLWLHIGSHKTGTTTLQSALRAAGRTHCLGDWNYVHSPKSINMNKSVSFKGEGAELVWGIRPVILKERIPPKGDCIISAERFFWLNRKEDIANLSRVLGSTFDDIRVIVYLRRQESLALSFRKTAISTALGRSFFGDGISALPIHQPYMDSYFDYAEKLKLWESVFGPDRIYVRRYGDRDTVTDFSEVIGQHIPQDSSSVNTSWSRAQLLAGLWLQSKGYSYSVFSPIIDDLKDQERLLPSRIQAEQFVSPYRESNRILAQKYDPKGDPSYFGEDFSKYLTQSNEDISDLASTFSEIEARMRQA